jgi:hypothetical protein
MRCIRLLMFRRRAVVIRRIYSVPERITVFFTAALMVGVIYPLIMTYTNGQGIPCLLLKFTGVPCPFCGLTTSTVAMAHGEWTAAAQTSPLACLIALMAVGTAPFLATRAAGLRPPPRPASERTRRRITQAVLAIVGLSWIFQLHRYGLI